MIKPWYKITGFKVSRQVKKQQENEGLFIVQKVWCFKYNNEYAM